MAKKVFISYRHQQAEWVRTTLYPVLSAGGADVVIDYKLFEAGEAIRRQMKAAQARADIHLLVFTPDYFKSDYCVEEMKRAFALDPKFSKRIVLPVILECCDLPREIQKHEPLYVNLSGGQQHDADAWKLLMERCEADLGASVPNWISAFKRTTDALQRRKSVNLLIKGLPKWRELVAEVKRALPGLGVVDLESGKTVTRRGLVGEILKELAGYNGRVPKEEDLSELERVLECIPPCVLAFKNFDQAVRRKYGTDFHSSLRYLVVEKRALALLVQSEAPFAALLPARNSLSVLDMEIVELREAGRGF